MKVLAAGGHNSPITGPVLAVEYFLICSARESTRSKTEVR
jgi:hypothetical protein